MIDNNVICRISQSGSLFPLILGFVFTILFSQVSECQEWGDGDMGWIPEGYSEVDAVYSRPDSVEDTTPPFLEVTEPADNFRTARRWIDIKGLNSDDQCEPHVEVNGVWVNIGGFGSFEFSKFELSNGLNRIVVTCHDVSGHVATQIVNVVQDPSLDSTPPTARLMLPECRQVEGDDASYVCEATFCGKQDLSIEGRTDDETAEIRTWAISSGVTNGPFYALTTSTTFWGKVTLSPGMNTVLVRAADAAGNASTSFYSIARETNLFLEISYPKYGQVMNAPSTEVWGVASSGFSNATIRVNGQEAYVFERKGHLGFVTWIPIRLNVNRTMSSVQAELDGMTFFSQ
jgi:hypothetical protein